MELRRPLEIECDPRMGATKAMFTFGRHHVKKKQQQKIHFSHLFFFLVTKYVYLNLFFFLQHLWLGEGQKGMATNSSILSRRIQWTEEAGGLQSMGSQRAGHD